MTSKVVVFTPTTERLHRLVARRTIQSFSYATVAADSTLITKERATNPSTRTFADDPIARTITRMSYITPYLVPVDFDTFRAHIQP